MEFKLILFYLGTDNSHNNSKSLDTHILIYFGKISSNNEEPVGAYHHL